MNSMLRIAGWMAALACAGCATVSTWQETGRVGIRIDDARVVTTNGLCRISVASINDERELDEKTAKAVAAGCHAMLIADLHHYRKYLAIRAMRTGSRTDVILDEPSVDYEKDAYVRYECGVRTVTERILFIPFAFAWDLVTLPVALCVGPFVHM